MKHTMRSLMGLILILAMMLSLAACGEKKDPEKQPEEHPEMVYAPDSIHINSEELTDGISPLAFTDDGFYGRSYGKLSDPIPVKETAEDETGSDTPADGEEPADDVTEPEEDYENYGVRLFFVSYEGAARELTGYAPMPAMEDPGDKLDFYSGSGLNSLFVEPDGSLLAVESLYCGWFDGTKEEMAQDYAWEKYRYVTEYYLRRLDSTGAELSCTKLDFDVQDMWLNFENGILAPSGELLVPCDQNVYCFAPDGSLSFRLEGSDWINSLVQLHDGSIYALSWGERGQVLIPIELEKKAFGKPVSVPNNVNSAISGDENYDFYYTNGMYLYGYHMDKEEETKIFNWLDMDINGESFGYGGGNLHFMADGTVICVLNQWKNDAVDTEIVHIRKVPYDSVPQKEILTMAVLYGYSIYDKVIDFNRHNDKVRIQVIDYSEFNDYENDNYDAGRTKLLTEIMSGQMPDIIALNELPYRQIAAKGLLEDLYPYLDKDPELSRDDLFPNVLQALEVNGKMCQITPSFYVETLIGASTVVGDKPGWTYQDLQAALATMPEDCDPLDMYTTREDMLRTLLYADMDHYVDWTTGKCNFESEDFIQMLEFVAMFPETIPDDLEWEDTDIRISQGKQMLSRAYLYSVDSMVWNDMVFGEQGCTYIGYPTNSGVGSVMRLDYGYGISSSCKNKEAAWEFVRSFITDDAQKNVDGIPVSLKAYQRLLKEAMTPEYQMDENGEYVKDDDGNRIQVPRGQYWLSDGSTKYIYAMTQEQADKLWEAVTTCTKVAYNDDSVYQIVYEQAQAYFSGQKSAKEVARLIQSKANIYINEQR